MTECLQCGLSLQGRDNECETCSDCLLGLTDEYETINQPTMTTYKRQTKREILLDPIDMTEELMSHIFDAEFGGELDANHRFFELYLNLQLFKEKMLNDERDAYVSVENDEVGV